MSARRILLNAAGPLRAALARAAAAQQQQQPALLSSAATAATATAASLLPATPTYGLAAAGTTTARLFAAAAAASDGEATAAAAASPPSLLSVLKREIKHERSAYSPPSVVASGPPAPFTLVDAPGEAAVTLKREYRGGETITVDCSVNLQDALGPPPGFEDDDDDDEDLEEEAEEGKEGKEEGDDDDDDEDGDDDDEDPGDVAFNVTVSKASGPSLVFECVSDGTYVDVRHVALETKPRAAGGEPNAADDDAAYSGPVFDELDEDLQDAFRSYLEARGVDEDLGEYLRWLLVDKEQREYTAWLEGVEAFVGGGGGK
jgi:hypothetical protein